MKIVYLKNGIKFVKTDRRTIYAFKVLGPTSLWNAITTAWTLWRICAPHWCYLITEEEAKK